MSFSINRNKSQLNSFSDTFNDGEFINGTYEKAVNSSLVEVTITTDQEVNLYSYHSRDGVNSITSTSDTVGIGTTTIRIELKYKYFKLTLENTSGQLTTITVDSYFTDEIPFRKPLNETNINENDATLTKSISVGKYGSSYNVLKVNPDGSQYTQITDGAGTVNTRTLSDPITDSDVGLVAHSVIHGHTTAGGGSFVDVKVTPSGALTVDATPDNVAFTTTATLGSGATYNSGILTLLPKYTQVQTNIYASHDGTINVYWYSDAGGTDLLRTISINYEASKGYQTYAAPAGFGTYVKYTYTNGATPQTDFYYSTTFLTHAQSPQIMNMESTILSKMAAMVTKSVLVGKTEGGNYYQNISSDNGGHLEVSLQSPRSAFGEVSVIEPYPVAQIDFVYGINTYLTNKIETGSGAVTGSGGLVVCSTTATTSSSAQINSLRYLKYRAGQGAKGMFTALFTTGVSNSNQYAGIFTPSLDNGFGFGYDGATFGIWYMKNGSPTHIPQTSWNNDLMNGAGGENNRSGMNLVPTNGNVYSITYQYLGFGSIKFYIENSYNGQFVLVHEIEYTNSYTTPSISQPSLSLTWKAENTTNNTNIVVKGASGALFIEGDRRLLGPSHGLDNNKSSITTITNIITLRNATSYNGITNRAHIRLRTVSFASNTGGAGSGITTLKIIRNATLGGSPSYTTINGTTADSGVTITSGNSITSYDTAGTTVTGGTVMFNSIIGVGNNADKDLSELDLFAYPGDIITFSITSTQSVTAGVGITWTEDI